MANSLQLTNYLKQLLKSENNYAVALTGKWGVGKTYFWKSFYEEHGDDFNTKKYAYVSLFGISSLSELKLKIATEVHSTSTQDDSLLNSDGSKFLKKLATNFIPKGGVELGNSGVALNLSSSLISNLIVKDLKDALICLDDAERLSKGLSINEVMGLVNYLKSEKNCTVIFILHQDKSKEKTIFEEYKEKVFDEIVLLDECLEVALSLFDNSYHEIISEFYDKFEIKNIRFYQQVSLRFQKFLDIVQKEKLSDTSKNEVLKTTLILWAFISVPIEMGFSIDKLKEDYSDRNYFKQTTEKVEKKGASELEKQTKKSIQDFYGYFQYREWQNILNTFLTEFVVSKEVATLINKDLITENKFQTEREFKAIAWDEFHSLDIKPNFPIRLHDALLNYLEYENYGNISFYCDVLEDYGYIDLAKNIENHTKKIIDIRFIEYSHSTLLSDMYPFIRENDRFRSYIENKISEKKQSNPKIDELQKIFTRYFEFKTCNAQEDKHILNRIEKDQLRQVVWASPPVQYFDRKNYIKSVVTHPSLIDGLQVKIRNWVVEILEEKIQEVPDSSVPIKYWLEATENLTKFK